jgi:signal transduction histidine kinase
MERPTGAPLDAHADPADQGGPFSRFARGAPGGRSYRASAIPSSGSLATSLPSPEKLAHDLNNYLAAISGLAQVARIATAAEQKDRYLTQIESAVSEMNDVIRDVLARYSVDNRRPADRDAVRSLLDEVAAMLRPRFEDRGVALAITVVGSLPTVPATRTALKQALLNVLDNALRATSPGGTVEVAASRSRRRAGIVLHIRDNGTGIPKKLLRLVLQPGYSTRSDGSGLGLPAAREIVEVLHGGRLTLRSPPGKGTTVRIFLPCQP